MKYRPLELRIKLYDEVRRLRGLGLSYREIIDEIERMYGVTLNKSHISFWIREVHNPYTSKRRYIPSIDYLRPSEELAYVIGAVLGDGCVFLQKYHYFITLRVKDLEFAEKFAECIGKVLEREPPKPIPVKNGAFKVKVCSKTLYELLKKPIDIDNIRKYVEHCFRCICAFLRGFFDSEGSIDKDGDTRVYNSDKSLLVYIKDLLNRFGIKTTGPKLHIKARTPIKNPVIDKTYFRKNDNYYLYMHAESKLKFYELIGFTIKRKQQRLEEYLIRRGLLKKKEEVLMYQTT